ncbi:MAG: BrnA antitoxin family protein [Rhizobiaceae bacterium]|nr:BrnA antitoxin family protein [Rhizobiaceae bacterium]
MKKKPDASATEWVDPDDAPEWTDEMLDRADLYHGEVLVRRGRPPSAAPKRQVTLRLSPEVLDHFKAGGAGWQTRIDETLKKAIGSG